jgi:hypothetical protein
VQTNSPIVVALASVAALLVVGLLTYLAFRQRKKRPELPSSLAPSPPALLTDMTELPSEFRLTHPSVFDVYRVQLLPPGTPTLFDAPATTEARDDLPPLALNQLLQSLPALAKALQGGTVVRVLGPESLLQGLQSGSLRLLESGGNLGTVVDKSGRIAGQLRFGDPHSLRVVSAPLAVFQVASLVTLQYYLHDISRRLATIQQVVEEVRRRFQHHLDAKVEAAHREYLHLEAYARGTATLTEGDRDKIDRCVYELREVYNETLKSLRDFETRVRSSLSQGKLPGRGEMKALLREASTDKLYDALIFVRASLMLLQLSQLAVAFDSVAHPERVAITLQNVRSEMEGLREGFELIRELYETLAVDPSLLRSAYRLFPNRLLQELDNFLQTTRPVLDAARCHLPDLQPVPLLIECRMGADGQLEARHALIEGPPQRARDVANRHGSGREDPGAAS